MEKQAFKKRWESNDNGGGITFGDIANCAIKWGLASHPYTQQIDGVRYRVLKAAGVEGAEEYVPNVELIGSL